MQVLIRYLHGGIEAEPSNRSLPVPQIGMQTAEQECSSIRLCDADPRLPAGHGIYRATFHSLQQVPGTERYKGDPVHIHLELITHIADGQQYARTFCHTDALAFKIPAIHNP